MSALAPHRAFKYDGRLYTVINPSPVEWIPGNVVVDPECNLDLRDLRKALWAVNRAPEMAYMLRRSHSDGRFFARLAINTGELPVALESGTWFISEQVRESWSRLENSLIYMCNVLFERTRSLTEASLPFDPHWPLPREMGYLQRHRTRDAAVRALWKSRDALHLLASRCTMAIALTNLLPTPDPSFHTPPRWQQFLMNAGVTSTWIDELDQSLITNLSPGLRVGAFICPVRGPSFTEWINHVPCMIKANIPVYIYWPSLSNMDHLASWDTITRCFPVLQPYRPYSNDVPEVAVSTREHFAYDRRGRVYVANPQNSFRWEDLPDASASSTVPSSSTVLASPERSIPHGPSQRPGESFEDFKARRAVQAEAMEKTETQEKRTKRLARQAEAAKYTRPTRRSHTLVYLWTTVGDIDPTEHWSLLAQPYRKLVGHKYTLELWEQYRNEDKHYDSWRDEWDICGTARDDAWDELSMERSTPFPEDARFEDLPDLPSAPMVMDCIASELSALYQAEADSDPCQVDFHFETNSAVFFYRYGILDLDLPPEDLVVGSPWLMHPPNVIRKHFGLPLCTSSEEVVDFPRHAASAFVAVVMEKTPSDERFGRIWDLNRFSPRYLGLPSHRHKLLEITRWDVNDPLCYAIRYKGDAPSWFEVLVDGATALELCRSESLSTQATVITSLSERGVAFRTAYAPLPREISPRTVMSSSSSSSSSAACLGWRLVTFRATRWDYSAYEERAHEILGSPRGRAAILHGGLVWRLALEILGKSATELASVGPSKDVFRYGHILESSRRLQYYEDALSPEEIDIICGTYKIADSGHKDPVYYSWWPRPSQWHHSGMNVGYWTSFCEAWFQERLKSIQAGTGEPHSGKEWRNKITFYKGAIKMRLAVDHASNRFLSNVLDVPRA